MRPQREAQEQPRRRHAPKGFVARRSVMRMVTLLVLLAITSGMLAFYQWWQAEKARRDLDAAEQRVARLWEDLQALERDNKALEASTAERLSTLNEKLDELAGPHLNWPVFEVYPAGALRRFGGSKEWNEIELPPRVSGFSLILNVENQTRHPDYRMEIIDASGKIIWQGDGLRPNQLNAFNVTLTRALLSDDRYTLKIYGKRGTRLVLLESYPIRITQRPGNPISSIPN